MIENLDLLERHEVAFVSLTESLDSSTATGRAIITIISAISQLEADLIRERVCTGLVNAKAKGVRLGAPPRYADRLPLIRHLASQRLSHREIAKLTGVSQATISRRLKVDSKFIAGSL